MIGSIRRECLDHIVILGPDHLRRIPQAHAAYYNNVRPHLALAKHAPMFRPVQRLRPGRCNTYPADLHHQYCRTDPAQPAETGILIAQNC